MFYPVLSLFYPVFILFYPVLSCFILFYPHLSCFILRYKKLKKRNDFRINIQVIFFTKQRPNLKNSRTEIKLRKNQEEIFRRVSRYTFLKNKFVKIINEENRLGDNCIDSRSDASLLCFRPYYPVHDSSVFLIF